MTVEIEKTSASAIDSLHSIYTALSNLNSQLEEHEYANSSQAVEYVNFQMEVKNSREKYIDLTSYAIFLNEFIKSINKWLTIGDIKPRMQHSLQNANVNTARFDAANSKEKELLCFLEDSWNKAKETICLDEVVIEVGAKREKCLVLTKKIQEIDHIFHREIKNQEEGALCIKEHEETLQHLNLKSNALSSFPDPAMQNMDDLHAMFNIKPYACNLKSEQLTQSCHLLKEYEDLGNVKLIQQTTEFEILEIAYRNVLNVSSSIEVKLFKKSFQNQTKLVDIKVSNCPIDISDLVEDAIELNDFYILIPELLNRLTESE